MQNGAMTVEPASDDALAARGGGASICVVDDDAYLRRALQRLLQAVGFTVKTFGSAEDFLAAEGGCRPTAPSWTFISGP
jgi:ActR/RegA family two-component response regulator